MMLRYFFLFVVFCSFRGFSFNPPDSIKEKLDDFIMKVREELKLNTGLSISVVKDGRVFFSKAYGYANREEEKEATVNTPFYIASSTKSFLGTLAKILSDEGVINLDSPISKYLPDLELPAPVSPEVITIRDLLTHRSGIESFPVVLRTAFTGQHTDEKLLELYKSSGFTTREFRYTNTDYVLVGLIIKKVTGKDWKELMKEKIFIPLEMNNTSTFVSSYKQGSLPLNYESTDGKADNYNYSKTDETMHAAGGIYSSAEDLSHWLLFNLGDGSYNGKQILSEYSLDEIHSAQINYSQTFFTYNRFAYGLGWIRSDYNGQLLIHHFGSYEGSRSHISFMPEEHAGVAALINDDGDAFYSVDLFADYAYNLLSGDVNADSIANAELNIILDKLKKKREKEKTDNEEEKPHLVVNNNLYTGKYSSSDYGEVVLSEKNGDLFLDFGNLEGVIYPDSANIFEGVIGAFETKIEFKSADADNRITELTIYGPVKMVFTKQEE